MGGVGEEVGVKVVGRQESASRIRGSVGRQRRNGGAKKVVSRRGFSDTGQRRQESASGICESVGDRQPFSPRRVLSYRRSGGGEKGSQSPTV